MSQPVTQQPAPKRARHLMDPDNPQRQVNDQALTRVQRLVMSVLAVTTIFHLSVGMVIAALFVPDDVPSAQIGLNVIGAAFGVVAVATGRLIHKVSVVTPWLLVGLLPGVVGLFLTFR